ncbi:MAG TPA: aspartate ammonia-lyase [Phycisphaerae bacterium]|nr:aspartate ammonia-lyase [Phycisphaerae bacterium]HOJ72878.1 aspartate ammonia-lyase [Phycisphaerae bacterium]HOM50062.1 aspartate ammonia-lyase [Phycisphaerae bacterium]HON68649.1 aspartate ammonia-lyase [Phycisphaerae bacterium]HPP26635.1 aspartate ammonia-lyase [Phycisphaerae bacterium]
MDQTFRTESDFLGEMKIPADALWGIHTARAIENFPLSLRPVHPALIRAYGYVKLACAMTNRRLGVWDDAAKADAIERACREMADGLLTEHVRVDALQGGAGTSTNMNVNEVLANRALQLLGDKPGNYARVSPTDDINRHQSTNDTYPTALRLAAIHRLRPLEEQLVALQESFQAAERRFEHVVKIGRTEMQDAVLTTLGREMSAYAEAFNRDRWRVYKCEERLRVVNLGGTAIGTGVTAPRQYIFGVSETLRQVTGIGFARAENLVEATQNADVWVEVSGILKACATSLLKICSDLRFMSCGPQAGIGEIRLPQRQSGSSIMPGKVNPVIPEAVSQAAMRVMSNDAAIAVACASGNLELNPFLPLVADCLLESIDLLARSCDILRRLCVDGIEADETRCRQEVQASTAAATALVPVLGYEGASELAWRALRAGRTIREQVALEEIMLPEDFDALVSAEAVCRLGQVDIDHPRPDEGGKSKTEQVS